MKGLSIMSIKKKDNLASPAKVKDGRAHNHGVYGHDGSNAGRPKLPPELKRKKHFVYANEKEWILIKEYIKQFKNSNI